MDDIPIERSNFSVILKNISLEKSNQSKIAVAESFKIY